MSKKRSSEFFGVKMEIFSGNVRENFLRPPNSAPGLRPWTAVKYAGSQSVSQWNYSNFSKIYEYRRV